METETSVTLNHSATNWSNRVKNNASPNISILDVVKSFVPSTDEVVNVSSISNFVLSSPISRYLEFCLFWVRVHSHTMHSNHEWHIPTVLSV